VSVAKWRVTWRVFGLMPLRESLGRDRDVTLPADVGRSKKIALNSVGVRSIRDIPGFDFSQVKLNGIGSKPWTT
jgi:hypothetical protein